MTVARVAKLRFAHNDERPLLDSVSFEVAAGEALAVTGPVDCGKSTLLHVLAGDLVPLAGEVVVDGPVRWLVPAVALTTGEAVDLGAVIGRDVLRFCNEVEPIGSTGLVLSDEPDCVCEPGRVRDLSSFGLVRPLPTTGINAATCH